MVWATITQNWELWAARVEAVFPHLDPARARFLRRDRVHFLDYLAKGHDLTPAEAEEILCDLVLMAPTPRRLVLAKSA